MLSTIGETLERRIRDAEASLFDSVGLAAELSYVPLRRVGGRVRVLSVGRGAPVLLLHGVSLCAAAWAPLMRELPGFRLHAVDLPGHGLSDPVPYARGEVRRSSVLLVDDLCDALASEPMPVIGHSLGAMFALWHAAERPGRIGSLVAVGDPAVAIPGVIIRMPLSLMTVPVIGPAVLRAPSPRWAYRRLLAMGLGRAAGAAAPDDLVDVLRLSARRPQNARTVGALMHAINRFRRPRPESVMDVEELERITAPTLFVWGDQDPYLPAEQARPWIEKIPSGSLQVMPGGHAPWFEDPGGCARAIIRHLAATGFHRPSGTEPAA
ncbi:MAG: alpha/beta hydrolase [Micromonosporaceae bacterium]|nr:alpha/beta hydrolase [Micromonosporaceae bacterium]